MKLSRRPGVALAAVAATATVLSLATTAAHADAPDDGLVAEYIFDQDSGTSVVNSAAGSSFGPAVVRNGQATDWTGDALKLRGGAKTSTGDWVELPDDLLKGATSATITAEVKPTEANLEDVFVAVTHRPLERAGATS